MILYTHRSRQEESEGEAITQHRGDCQQVI